MLQKELFMNKLFSSTLLLVMLIPCMLFAQLRVSGEFSPGAMFRTSNGKVINLPFRPVNISVDYARGDFVFKTSTAIETRWKDAEISDDMVQFREAYLEWYPSFGAIRLGKLIHTWGAADGNNPTDNLSPYDYYYMFLSGTDRKLGTLSVAGKAYFGDVQVELILIPEFESNRFPLNEPDFPIQIPIPADAIFSLPEDEFEFGARLQYALGIGDISASYFRGHDRSFSPASMEVDISPFLLGEVPNFISHLSYRSTDVIGVDAVLFPGNWTLRGEFAYFRTTTPEIDYDISKFIYDAQYLQSVVQLEYAFANTVQLMGQLINTNYLSTESEFIPGSDLIAAQTFLQDTSDHALDPIRAQLGSISVPAFSAGMGTPFAIIADRVVMLSSMITLLDNNLELGALLMINLEATGYMSNLKSSYSVAEGLTLDAALSYFIGGEEDGNKFKPLEDFSNLTLGLTYSF